MSYACLADGDRDNTDRAYDTVTDRLRLISHALVCTNLTTSITVADTHIGLCVPHVTQEQMKSRAPMRLSDGNKNVFYAWNSFLTKINQSSIIFYFHLKNQQGTVQ